MAKLKSYEKNCNFNSSATEIVAFLGEKSSIIGCSHECDYPKDLNNIVRFTSPKINIHGTSKTINKEITQF